MAKKHLNFTDEMLDKYYKSETTISDMENIFDVSRGTIYSRMKEYGITPKRKIWTTIDLPNKLVKNLMNKYNSLVDRCTKKRRYQKYYKLEYLSIKEFAVFCNENKKKLLKMWDKYLTNDKKLKYAISIDRLDTNKGYIKSNIQFVPYGFNSWKDGITPLKVKYENNIKYCLSKEEASRRLGFKRKKIVGEAERNENDLDIKIKYLDDKEKVLQETDCKSLFKYYKKFIE